MSTKNKQRANMALAELEKEMDTDCYGVTFGDGKFWINNDQVPSILKGDAYKEVSEGNYQTDISTTSLKSGFHRYNKIKVFRK